MLGKMLIFTAILLMGAPLNAQKPPETEEEFEKVYQRRIKQEYLYGVYIPKDLADVFIQLNRLIDEGSRNKFKNLPEEVAGSKFHFSLGRWIIHNWGFYGGSRLSHYIQALGISYPDDMARFILISYHRSLRRVKLDIKSQVDYYTEKREKQNEERLKKGTVIHQETRKRPKG